MKRLILLLLLLGFGVHFKILAQVIGDEGLQRIQDGQVSFLEGEFIVFLNDTVSPDFIERKFSELDYNISFSDINPILISIVNSPDDSVLTNLGKHPNVNRSYIESIPVDSSYFRELLEEQGLLGAAFEQAFSRLVESQTKEEYFFEFDYSVNESRLKEIMGSFRSVAYQLLQNYTRSVNVTCTPGKEQELMEEIEQLPYVENTALIGVLGD
tara:strand:+ start:91180 stop:91815 length:636 start_codon:yes stop_codon:yes gene_type:complete